MASEYGWAKDYIFDKVYFDELIVFMDAIKRRRNAKYHMFLAIAQTPNNKKAYDMVFKALEADAVADTLSEELDEAGMSRLKLVTSKNPRIIVK